jgi:TolB-like protein
MTEPEARVVYEFGGFRLDARQRLLSAIRDSSPIALPARVFDTLLYFVERHGEMLDKATLMKAIWPNLVVEENSLNQNISTLRRVLGEGPGEHRFIVTVPGRGYQFVADVRRVSNSSAQASRAPAQQVAASEARPPGVTQRASIAVLPFANLTRDPDKEYFGDGMAEELIHMLARIPGLKVPARTSSFAYKGRNVDVRQIARDLEVGSVLEGSVRSAGERIRVTAQLIDAESGYHLWTESYDRQFEDLFKLQDDLAGAIVRALRVSLDGASPPSLTSQQPTTDLEAYHLYLQAMATHAGVGEQSLQRSFEMLQRAVTRDPRFARAYNAIAALRAVAIVIDAHLPGTLADAERDVRHALALDPSLGAAHAALGIISGAQGKWVDAEERFQEAFTRDATDPATRLAYGMHVAGSAGFLRRCLESLLEAHRLAPAWVVSLVNLSVAYQILDQHEDAMRYVRLAVDMGLPKAMTPVADVLSGLALSAGRNSEAAQHIIDALSPSMQALGGRETVRKVFAAFEDRTMRKAAVAMLDKHRLRLAAQDLTQIVKRRFMVWYTSLGALDQAFEIANESLDYFARAGTIGAAWAFLWMPRMLPFRQDARFQRFVARMGLPAYWQKYGPPDNCALRDGKLVCS